MCELLNNALALLFNNLVRLSYCLFLKMIFTQALSCVSQIYCPKCHHWQDCFTFTDLIMWFGVFSFYLKLSMPDIEQQQDLGPLFLVLFSMVFNIP